MTEYEIHKAVVENLRQLALPDVVWFHVPNSPRSPMAGFKLKRMGMLAGAPDLILLHRGDAFALELKAKKGRQSPAQKEFHTRWVNAGGFYCVANTLDWALAWLGIMGLIGGVR